MRTIEFKAKRIGTKEWIEGDLIHYGGLLLIAPCKGSWLDFIGRKLSQAKWEVDPETICQFTGLTDKNGNKIWEGDVLTNDIVNLQVVFRQGAFTVTHRKGDYAPIGWGIEQVNYSYENYPSADDYDFIENPSYLDDIKVIGNRFDNPELLTQ